MLQDFLSQLNQPMLQIQSSVFQIYFQFLAYLKKSYLITVKPLEVASLPIFLCRSNVTHYFSSTYYSQGNGGVERLHGTLKQRLQKLLYESCDLQQVLFDMGQQEHLLFFLMLGREMQGRWNWFTGHTTCPITDLQQRYDTYNC